MAPTYEFVKVQMKDGVVLLKYNRPGSGNSLYPKMLSEMLSAMQWADSNPDVKVIVQSGEGRFFCTGMELVENSPAGDQLAFTQKSAFYKLNRLLITSTKILVAAVNGPAAGYGVSSLALYDLVYAVPDAYFFTPFVKWGMAAEGASSVTFPRVMGYQKAAALFLAGERMTAQELEQVGLISKILPKENFLEQVVQIAARIAESPPGSLKAVKELMKQPMRNDLLEANERECAVLRQRLVSGEPEVAMKAFQSEQEQKRREKGTSRL